MIPVIKVHILYFLHMSNVLSACFSNPILRWWHSPAQLSNFLWIKINKQIVLKQTIFARKSWPQMFDDDLHSWTCVPSIRSEFSLWWNVPQCCEIHFMWFFLIRHPCLERGQTVSKSGPDVFSGHAFILLGAPPAAHSLFAPSQILFLHTHTHRYTHVLLSLVHCQIFVAQGEKTDCECQQTKRCCQTWFWCLLHPKVSIFAFTELPSMLSSTKFIPRWSDWHHRMWLLCTCPLLNVRPAVPPALTADCG